MPIWGWILLIAGLSFLTVASLYAVVHHTHRRMPARQAAQGDTIDLSAPLPMHIVYELDEPTARERHEERQRDDTSRSTYEIARGRDASAPTEVVTDLPPATIGEILFYHGGFWKVDAIEAANRSKARGRLIVSPTTDAPRPHPAVGGAVRSRSG